MKVCVYLCIRTTSARERQLALPLCIMANDFALYNLGALQQE
jgi:hypothetical protein